MVNTEMAKWPLAKDIRVNRLNEKIVTIDYVI